jgi:sulfite reductase (NADPH) flavoprotein alpha-component
MIPPKIKGKLLLLHRWLALAFSPVLLLIFLSGALLAVKVIVHAGPAAPSTPVDPLAVAAAVTALDPADKTVVVTVSPSSARIGLRTSVRGDDTTYDLATRAPAAQEPKPFDLFDLATRMHRKLLVGADVVVTAATFVMVALLILGPLIAWPRRRNTVAGWHTGMGWFLWPLVAMTPVTGALLSLPKTGQSRPAAPQRAPGINIPRALEAAAAGGTDLRTMILAQRVGQGVLITTAHGAAPIRYLVAEDGKVTSVQEKRSLLKLIHEGTWAGAPSAAINLLAAAGLLALLGTGTFAWTRRRLRSGARKPA